MLKSKILKNLKNLKKNENLLRHEIQHDDPTHDLDMRSNIKLIICQMSKCQTPGLWRRLTKKKT